MGAPAESDTGESSHGQYRQDPKAATTRAARRARGGAAARLPGRTSARARDSARQDQAKRDALRLGRSQARHRGTLRGARRTRVRGHGLAATRPDPDPQEVRSRAGHDGRHGHDVSGRADPARAARQDRGRHTRRYRHVRGSRLPKPHRAARRAPRHVARAGRGQRRRDLEAHRAVRGAQRRLREHGDHELEGPARTIAPIRSSTTSTGASTCAGARAHRTSRSSTTCTTCRS